MSVADFRSYRSPQKARLWSDTHSSSSLVYEIRGMALSRSIAPVDRGGDFAVYPGRVKNDVRVNEESA